MRYCTIYRTDSLIAVLSIEVLSIIVPVKYHSIQFQNPGIVFTIAKSCSDCLLSIAHIACIFDGKQRKKMTHRGSHACRYRRCNMFDYTDTRETLKSTAWMSVLLSINIKYNHIQIVSSFIIAIFLSIASIPFIFVCPPRQRGTHGDKIDSRSVL